MLDCTDTYWLQMLASFVGGMVLAGLIATCAWPSTIYPEHDEHEEGGIGS